jgi:HEAT repeat protein
MKKIYITLFAALMLQNTVNAQDNAKITGLLAQMPAKDATTLQKDMAAVATLGEDDYVTLINGLATPGNANNAPIEYTVSGFSAYVTKAGNESLRKMSVSAYGKALQKLTDKKNKQFIISQFDIVGKDDAITCLQGYLTDNDLADAAARALVKINTPASKTALLNALSQANGTARLFIIEALGDSRYSAAAAPINTLAAGDDPITAKVALYTLAQIANPSSEPILAAAADKSGYKYEKTNATGAYLVYAENLLKNGNTVLVQKIANHLITKATTPDLVSIRINALQLRVKASKAPQQLLLTAAGDADPQYRAAALRYALPYLTPATTPLWTKKLATVNDAIKIDILYMLGQSSAKSALSAILALTKSKDQAVKVAAINAAVNIGQEQVLGSLIKLMINANSDDVDLITGVISRMKGTTVAAQLAAAVPGAPESTQATLIDMLDSRAAIGQYNAIYAQLKSKNPRTRHAAYAALSHVSTPENLPQLFKLLYDINDSEESAVQDALIYVLSGSGNSGQKADLVLQQMASAPENKKPLFYKILGSLGDNRSLKVVIEGYESANPQIKKVALSALATWPNDAAARDLVKIAREAKDPEVQNIALGGYVGSVQQGTYTPEQRLLLLREAMSAAQNTDQKKQILKEIEKAKCYNAILFAGKYLDDTELQQAAATTVATITLAGEYSGDLVKQLLTKTAEVIKGRDAGAQKDKITKYLAGMKAETGFVQVFNGKDLTGWKGLVADPIKRSKMDAKTLEEAQVKADAMARDSWKVINGELVFQSHGDNLATIKKYADFEMLVDWKIIDDKKGQGDAGIYLRGSPQVQIWDLARTNVGAQVGSGGLYNNQVYPSKPLVVADNKLDEWNTFRILMKGDRVTVWLNGVLVTDNVMLENYWDRKQPIFPEEQIELQAHGSPVAYRDIYIREIPRAKPFELSADEKKEGFKVLFDGTNMFNWIGNTIDYSTEDGNLVIRPKPVKESAGDINIKNLYTKDEYSDFVFRFEFQLTPGANNGLGIRAPLEGDAAYTGMELQILDNEAPMYKDLHVYQYHGSVYGTIPAKRGFLKPVGEWNYEEVIVKGPLVKVILNGTVILDSDLTPFRKNGAPDGKPHPGLLRDSGHIGFLGHGSVVSFRNIRVKDLSEKK